MMKLSVSVAILGLILLGLLYFIWLPANTWADDDVMEAYLLETLSEEEIESRKAEYHAWQEKRFKEPSCAEIIVRLKESGKYGDNDYITQLKDVRCFEGSLDDGWALNGNTDYRPMSSFLLGKCEGRSVKSARKQGCLPK